MTYPLVRQPPLSRAARKTATREAIIDAAAWLFARRGIEATSLDAIATRVGLTKGAVYGNFKSKRALVDAVAAAKSAHLDIRPLLRRDLSLDARLRLFARESVALIRGVSRQIFLLDFEYQVYAKRNRAWGEHVRLSMRRYLAGIVLEFEAVNRERGEALPMPATEFFDALITVSRGVAHQLALDPDAISAEAVEKVFVQLGLVCP